MDNWEIVIVGGGPAGLTAGARSALGGKRTLLLEKNRKPGVKILISGGTRCNFTHATDARGIVEAFGPPGRFLHSALAALGPQDVVDLFLSEGVPAKIEPDTGKVFPAGDRASDVLAALIRRLKKNGCALAGEEPLIKMERSADGFRLITSRRTISAQKILLATGGKSYPACGTTGDGYSWAAELGHTIVPPCPALAPVTTHASWVTALQGITIADASVQVVEPLSHEKAKSRCLAGRRGSLLFTHFGLSGPAVLDVSRVISRYHAPQTLILECDFMPGVPTEELDAMIAAQCATAGGRQAAVILDRLLPRRLADAILEQAQTPPGCRGAELSKPQRHRLIRAIKQCPIPVAGTMGFRKAEVTAGGVALDEVDSRSMQSKIVPGLYFAGELLDLDGPIGGYNFQAAFSTGYLAGESM
ncbi:MAG: NAD(P)/FAD-dependent oxidoreductase [Thermoguttaceae bacterium]|jgi:predicted Rossmann fold flavoprotein